MRVELRKENEIRSCFVFPRLCGKWRGWAGLCGRVLVFGVWKTGDNLAQKVLVGF